MNEEQLKQSLIAGDEKAFRSFMESHEKKVFRTCIGFLHNKEDAEDLTQEVFIEVFRSVKNFRGESSLSTWVYRIAVNKSLNFLKQKNNRGFIFSVKSALGLLPEIARPENPHSELEKKESENILIKAIDSLPEKQRIAYTLVKYEELSYKEVAEIMETSLSSVESLMHRAKGNLQDLLKKHL